MGYEADPLNPKIPRGDLSKKKSCLVILLTRDDVMIAFQIKKPVPYAAVNL